MGFLATFGGRFAEARRRAGLRQADLAAHLGGRYDRSVISKIERGKSSMRIDRLALAAPVLSVSSDYLLGLVDAPAPVAVLLRERAARRDTSP